MTNLFASFNQRLSNNVAGRTLALVVVLLSCGGALAQSTDQEAPTPIRAGDISATIAVRDLGDPRLTRHFFIFTGTPGDLLISVESKNLNGDVDVFTVMGFRPLVKISLYASEVAARTTKSIYLRSRQDLILRVEARSPNDDEGSYHLQFGGSFEPFSGEIAAADNAEAPSETAKPSSSGKKGRRVSAVGARIEEPPTPVEEKAAGEQPTTETPVAPEKTEPTSAEPVRTARGTRPTRGRTPRASRAKPAPKAGGTARKKPETPATEGEEKSGEPGKAAGETSAAPPAGAPPAQVESGPRLIIETRDGDRIERSMSTVRRVVVDNGQIVVILKTGKIERVPMTNVARMSIEP